MPDRQIAVERIHDLKSDKIAIGMKNDPRINEIKTSHMSYVSELRPFRAKSSSPRCQINAVNSVNQRNHLCFGGDFIDDNMDHSKIIILSD